MKSLPHYLRVHRMRTGLSQKDMAHLLGFTSGSSVSRHERQARDPSLKLAFMYQVIFDISPLELFPRLFTLVEEETIRRVYELHERLGATSSRGGIAKRQALRDAMSRASARLKESAV